MSDQQTTHVDDETERAVLGAVLISGVVLPHVLDEGVRPHHFWRESHQRVFTAMMTIADRNQGIDSLTVHAELLRMGVVVDRGAVEELVTDVPSVGNVRSYAMRVRELADWRARVAALYELQAAAQKADIEEWARAYQRMELGAHERRRESYSPGALGDLLFEYFAQRDAPRAVPFPFLKLTDSMAGGLRPGESMILAGYTAHGKALDVQTRVPTPDGWTTMGEIAPGSYVFGSDGLPTRVTHVGPVLTGRLCYELTFAGNVKVVADAEHQWVAFSPAESEWEDASTPAPRTTETLYRELGESGLDADGRWWTLGAIVPPHAPQSSLRHVFQSIRCVESRPVRCISVEADDHLFLVGESYVPTHNSVFADQMLDVAAKHGWRSHCYMTEMTAENRGLRMLSRLTGIPYLTMRRRTAVTDEQREKIDAELGQLPWGVSVVADWDIDDVVRDALRARYEFVVIDLIHGFHYQDERDLDRLSKALGRLARVSTTIEGHPGTVVVGVAHLNESQMAGSRSPARPRPGMQSLKGGSSLKQDADFVCFVWQQDNEAGIPTGEGAIWLPKSRSGGPAEVPVRINSRRFRFDAIEETSVPLPEAPVAPPKQDQEAIPF